MFKDINILICFTTGKPVFFFFMMNWNCQFNYMKYIRDLTDLLYLFISSFFVSFFVFLEIIHKLYSLKKYDYRWQTLSTHSL